MARRGDAIYLRGRTWWLDFTHQGQRHAIRLGSNINRTTAREIASVKRAEILKGEAGIGRKRKDLAFDKAKEKFLAWAEVNTRRNTFLSYHYCLVQLGRAFSGKRLSEIHPFALEHYKRNRLAAGAKVAVNRELTTLKGLYNMHLKWGLYEGENPVRQVKPVEEPEGRLRYLEPDEEDKLLRAANEPLRTIILTGIHAGLRIHAEALTLRWADVDFRRGQLTILSAYGKNRKPRTIPMNSVLRAALLAIRERNGDGELVFPRRDGDHARRDIRTAFENARMRAGLGEDVTPHVLRHTFCSRLVTEGVDLRTVMELGGWSSLTMVQRYSHLSPRHKAEAVERLARKIPQRDSQHGEEKEAVGSALVVVT